MCEYQRRLEDPPRPSTESEKILSRSHHNKDVASEDLLVLAQDDGVADEQILTVLVRMTDNGADPFGLCKILEWHRPDLARSLNDLVCVAFAAEYAAAT